MGMMERFCSMMISFKPDSVEDNVAVCQCPGGDVYSVKLDLLFA